MKINEDKLKLGESYKFDVKVNLEGHFFRGTLNLTPQKCELTITGEISKGRELKNNQRHLTTLSCSNVALNFILFNLKAKGLFWTVLERHPEAINAFEMSYEVGYAICSKSSLSASQKFSGLDFSSPSLDLWVGETTIQREIIDHYHKKTLFTPESSITPEFVSHVQNLGMIAIDYSTSLHYSTSDFSAGVKFPPKLIAVFDEPKSGADCMEAIDKICDLFSVLLGHRIHLQVAWLMPAEENRYNNASLYFPQSQPATRERSYAFFPLGINLARNELGLPPFPLESFDIYFQKKEIQTHFKKYARYRELENPEEQFLGYFRLLEKLTAATEMFVDEEKLERLINRFEKIFLRQFDNKSDAKKLLKQIARTNKSKSNTAGCIVKLLRELPGDLTKEWIFQPKDVQEVCKLRNDLTHANELEPDPNNIRNSTKFIEILLVFALFRAIGIPITSTALVAPRLQAYYLLKPPLQPVSLPSKEPTS